MIDKNTNRILLHRARDLGDQDAWHQLHREYGASVLRQARQSGLSHADAEDLRQVIMCRLMAVLPRFRYRAETGRFRNFLRVMIRNAALRVHQRHRRDPVPLLTESIPPASTRTAENDADKDWMNNHLSKALQSIAATVQPKSLAILRRYLGGESTEEIAVSMNMETEAVRKAGQRMRARLAAQIHRQVEAEQRSHEGVGR